MWNTKRCIFPISSLRGLRGVPLRSSQKVLLQWSTFIFSYLQQGAQKNPFLLQVALWCDFFKVQDRIEVKYSKCSRNLENKWQVQGWHGLCPGRVLWGIQNGVSFPFQVVERWKWHHCGALKKFYSKGQGQFFARSKAKAGKRTNLKFSHFCQISGFDRTAEQPGSSLTAWNG